MSVVDPLGLTRCATCSNAYDYDRADDGTCRRCGGRYDEPTPDEATAWPRA